MPPLRKKRPSTSSRELVGLALVLCLRLSSCLPSRLAPRPLLLRLCVCARARACACACACAVPVSVSVSSAASTAASATVAAASAPPPSTAACPFSSTVDPLYCVAHRCARTPPLSTAARPFSSAVFNMSPTGTHARRHYPRPHHHVPQQRTPGQSISNDIIAPPLYHRYPFFKMACRPKSRFEMCVAIGSQHRHVLWVPTVPYQNMFSNPE